MIALPAYIDKEAWDGYVAMRREIKKPLTTHAAKLVLYELQRIKDAGHDANAALNQSAMYNYLDVYPAKQKEIKLNRATEADRTAEFLAERDQITCDPERAAEALLKARTALRRVS